MGWERRRKKDFYYRSQRTGNQVRKVYLGGGEIARQAAAKDAATKARRAADQAALAELQAKLAGLDGLANEAQQGAELLTEAALLAIGFREHRGEWRLRRD
jgi:hypothetical protein